MEFDVIIIGSGGGSKITRPAASLGLNVAIIEKDELGGTCLNHGCIPSKMLIYPAQILNKVKTLNKFHINIDSTININFKKIMKEVNKTVEKESNAIEPLYKKITNITTFRGTASFINNHTLKVNEKIITGKKIFIVAGSRPFIPNIPGLKNTPYITSKEALKLTKQPKEMIIIGGGYIATELGFFYQMMGTKVTFIVRSKLVKEVDTDIQKRFQKIFCKNHHVKLDANPINIKYENNKFLLKYTQNHKESQIEADTCLIATGVIPNTDLLNIENTDIKLNKNKSIQVNDYLETNVKNIWAFGDIIGKYYYRHSANFQGEYLFQNIFKSKKAEKINYPAMPQAVFTNPEIASVGPKESDLPKNSYYIGENEYKSSGKGMAMKDTEGYVKLIFSKSTDQLIAAHIIGESASDIIHMPIAFIEKKATLEDMKNTIYIHPALSENIRNAARNVK
tara:strand:+ start:1797 stop:3149 length:1353 start_codon:yes stop_codon:yes gene_type:complete